MALLKPITLDTGIDLVEAYCRVTDVVLSYGQDRGVVTVSTYKDKQSRKDGMKPLRVTQYRVDNTGATPQVESTYLLSVDEVAAGSEASVTVDLNGDSTIDVLLIEGTDFQADGTLETASKNITDALNLDAAFNQGFTAVDLMGSIQIVAKADGAYAGALGNAIVFSGTAVAHQMPEIIGADETSGNFDAFFGVPVMDAAGVNAIGQSYEFLKTTSDFKDAANG